MTVFPLIEEFSVCKIEELWPSEDILNLRGLRGYNDMKFNMINLFQKNISSQKI